ncbi:MAG: hypothetical protein WBI53_03680 [Paludibacter sp.]
MSFTVGLDFGTHQTKVCIENATNPAQKLYEFVEFKNSIGKATVLFPSVVQINNDDTISYGFINITKCKIIEIETMVKPKLELFPEPILKLPEIPLKPKYPDKPTEGKKEKFTWKEQLQELKNRDLQNKNFALQNWKEECKNIERQYDEALKIWGEKIKTNKEKHNREIELWKNKNNDLRREYDKKIIEWEKNRKEKLHFQYFKLASFSNSINWNHQINSDIISVWYIAYILFILQEKLGEEFFVQMGIPSGINETIFITQRRKAYNILVAAYKLVDLYKTKETYLSEKYTNLLEITEINKHSEDDILHYGLNVIPEAYAGLFSITQQKRLEPGMSLLVDIGGGTTDVAFFTIRNNQPDIHAVISFPKGLNFIFEQYIIQNTDLSFADVQRIFYEKRGEDSLFNSSINKYKKELFQEVEQMVMRIQESFEQRKEFHKFETSKLTDALKNRTVVFCGGGAIYKSMQATVSNFTDIRLIDKNLLNIPFIINRSIDEELFTILATSFGLSIPSENDIKLTPIEQVFNHIITPDSNEKDYSYEYGLSDI